MRALNLASQPFKNERLPSLLLVVAGLVLVAVTVAHVLAVRRLMPRHTSALRREVADLEREADGLRDQTRGQRAPRPDATTLAEWTLLKDLVDKRAFSWTRLFAVLEESLPDGVRLVSVAPQVSKGELALDLSSDARSYQDGLQFLAVLQERPEFSDVKPISRTERDQAAAYQYHMSYHPEASPSKPAPVASPTPGPPEVPAASAAPGPSEEP